MVFGPHAIEADANTLMKQAPATVETYLTEAIRCLDDRFGPGFAMRTPALVGAFINAAAIDLGAAVIAQQIRLGLEGKRSE
jgi:hypothetical protein